MRDQPEPQGQRPDGRERRSARTRALIFDAALAEFRRVGVEAASVARVARLAGVSRPSFYFHFPSKEHLLLELQRRLEEEIVAAMSPIASPSQALHRFVDQLIASEAELASGELFRDILRLWARPPAALDLAEQRLPVVEEVVRRFLAHSREGGRLASTPERSALLFLAGVFGYLLGIGDPSDQRGEDLHALVALHLGETR